MPFSPIIQHLTLLESQQAQRRRDDADALRAQLRLAINADVQARPEHATELRAAQDRADALKLAYEAYRRSEANRARILVTESASGRAPYTVEQLSKSPGYPQGYSSCIPELAAQVAHRFRTKVLPRYFASPTSTGRFAASYIQDPLSFNCPVFPILYKRCPADKPVSTMHTSILSASELAAPRISPAPATSELKFPVLLCQDGVRYVLATSARGGIHLSGGLLGSLVPNLGSTWESYAWEPIAKPVTLLFAPGLEDQHFSSRVLEDGETLVAKRTPAETKYPCLLKHHNPRFNILVLASSAAQGVVISSDASAYPVGYTWGPESPATWSSAWKPVTEFLAVRFSPAA